MSGRRPSVEHPSIHFIVQLFEHKALCDSAAYTEIVAPMRASGLLGADRITVLPVENAGTSQEIIQRIVCLAESLGSRPVILYGAGAHSRLYWPHLKRIANICAVADRQPELWGHDFNGIPIIAPGAIPEYGQDVVISSRAFSQAIEKDLQARFEGKLALHALYPANYNDDAGTGVVSNSLKASLLHGEDAPDILFFIPGHPAESCHSQIFLSYRRRNSSTRIITLWWDYDEDPRSASYLDFERDSLTYSDLVIENSNVTRLERMRQRQQPYENHKGAERVVFLPTIFDPDTFYPLDVAAEEQTAEPMMPVVVFGSSVGARSALIARLRADLGEDFYHVGGVSGQDHFLPMRDYAACYRRALISVNAQTYSFRSQCKGKVREALCSGTFLLEEDNPETRSWVPEGCGLIYYQSYTDLLRKIRHYLTQPREREEILRQGQAWIESHWTPRLWTATLLQALAERKGDGQT